MAVTTVSPEKKKEEGGGGEEGGKNGVITRYESRAFEPFKNLQLVHSAERYSRKGAAENGVKG